MQKLWLSSFLQSQSEGRIRVAIRKYRLQNWELYVVSLDQCAMSHSIVLRLLCFRWDAELSLVPEPWVMVTMGRTLPPSSSSPPPWQRSVSTRHTAVQVTDKVNIIMRCSAYSVSIKYMRWRHSTREFEVSTQKKKSSSSIYVFKSDFWASVVCKQLYNKFRYI